MKKYILLSLLLAPFSLLQIQAQNYIVSSLATPGAATFTADEIVNGVITLPFIATTHTIQIETNQNATVSCDADWCQPSFADKTLTLTVTENPSEDARTAILSVRSKDFRPLLITVRQEARLTFAVISDTHIGNNVGEGPMKKVPQALRNLTRYGKLDALAVVGDLTDHGDVNQYQGFDSLFNHPDIILNPVDKFLFMMGNHDNYNGSGQYNYKNGLRKFNDNKTYPLHQLVYIKGYPFITLSVLAGANNDDNNDGKASYPDETISTLNRYLADAAKNAPGKPIFIFAHVAPRNTCYSTWGALEGAAWAMWRLNNSNLRKYPQAVVFCGHSHYPLGDPRSIHQGANPNSTNKNYYTVINTASTTYSEINPGAVDAGIHPEGYAYVTEGMILVEQSNGDIEIRRYDTYRDVEIDPDHRWVLKYPFDGSKFEYADIRDANDNPNNVVLRDGLPAPVFDDGAELKLKPLIEDVKITFPQATDNECVFRYNIRVLKGNTVVKNAFIFSQFYLTTDMPKKLSYTATGLTPNTEYTVEVVAYDSYDNQSTPLTATFTTLNDDGSLPEAQGIWTFDDADNLLAGTGVATLQGAIMEMGSLSVVDNLASVGITPVAGQTEGNGAITIPVASGLMMTSNLEEQSLDNYTFMFDIRSEELNGYTAIYQNDITNQRDGSFYIKDGMLGLNSNGLGYSGSLTSGKWHRVVFVVKNYIPYIYLDGRQIGQATSANDSKWKMSTGAIFFMDEDGEEHRVETSEIRFWDIPLTRKQIEHLGNANNEALPEPEPKTIPEAIGVWTFDNTSDLLAGTGVATLQGTTHTQGNVTIASNLADAGIVPVEGPEEGNGAVIVPKNSSLLMTSNIGTSPLTTYSILWDIKTDNYYPFSPLLQNDLTNSKDGSLFLSKNMVGLNAGNLGYHGTLTNGNWYRILFVVKNNYATVYVDGNKVGASTSAIPQHWQLTTGALFFADEDGEEETIKTAEIRFWDVALDDDQAATIGAAGNKIENSDPDDVPETYGSWTFNNIDDPLVKTGGTGKAQLHPYKKDSDGSMFIPGRLSEADITTANGPAEGNSAVYVPENSSLYLSTDLRNISTYSFLMDVKLNDTSGYASLYQNDITNQKDASLFVKDGQIGLNNAGLGYNGTINAGQWYRIVVVVEDNYSSVYIDGQKVIKSINTSNEHWFMKAGLVFFADQDGEEKPFTISELHFWDKALNDKQVFKLGTVGGNEAQEVAVPDATGAWTFDNPDNRFAGTGTATLTGWKKAGDGISITGPLKDIVAISGPTENNGAVIVPVGYALELTTNLEATTLDSYSWLMDVKLDDVSNYAALFQNDGTNQKDGSLFVKDGMVGLSGQNGTGYHGTINAGQWHRIVFVVSKNFGYVYIDGVKVGRSIHANTEHWQMGRRALFFTDNDGEEKEVNTSEIRFWDKTLTEGEIEKLGAVPME